MGAADRVLRATLRPLLKLAAAGDAKAVVAEFWRIAPTQARFFDSIFDPQISAYRASLEAVRHHYHLHPHGQGTERIADLGAEIERAAQGGSHLLKGAIERMLASGAAELASKVLSSVDGRDDGVDHN